MALRVREKPPLRHHIEAVAPSGRHYRWGADEPDPAKVFSGLRWSSTMPGGWETQDCVLPRLPGIEYSDLERLTTIRVIGAGGAKRGEFRLERAPRVSGERMAISPSAVGWQAALEDVKDVRVLYLDRTLANWKEPSRERHIALLDAGWNVIESGGSEQDATSGLPCLLLRHQVQATDTNYVIAESWYDAGGDLVSDIEYAYEIRGGSAAANALHVGVADNDQALNAQETVDLYNPAATGSGTFTPSVAKRWAYWRFLNQATYADDKERTAQIKTPIVWGNHDLPRYGTGLDRGVLGSDVRRHAIQNFVPALTATDESVQPSAAVLLQLSYANEPTTVSEIVKQSNRLELHDWAVWNDRTFWSYHRGAKGKRWRTRVGPSQLEETGPQVDRLWESITVAYQDVDGPTRTVGPPGSGADTETASLKDPDPQNPANRLGIPRRDTLVLGIATLRSAIEAGVRFLEETKLLDTSGRAQIVGYAWDDRGVVHPYSAVQAGDYLSVTDAGDKSYRRIVKADHSYDTRTCSVDLDSPPEALAAVLEQMSATLVSIGL